MNFLIDLNKTAKHVQPFLYEELEEETILDVNALFFFFWLSFFKSKFKSQSKMNRQIITKTWKNSIAFWCFATIW